MIANRLKPQLLNIIHLDQMGFSMGLEATDNVLKTVSLIKATQHFDISAYLLSVDAEKAFEPGD